MRPSLALMLLAVAAAPMTARADLLGDTLDFNRAYPTPTTPYWTVPTRSTTVTADSSDRIDWFSNGFSLTIDPGADAIVFNLISASSFIGLGAEFDGFRVTGFNQDIISAAVVDNDSGLAVATSFAGRVLDVDLSGSNVGGSTGFTIAVATAVPEPATWALWLASAAALGTAARRRG